MIALGRALLARGHEVTLQTWQRWREHVEAEGMRFAPAPEYAVFPQGAAPLDFYAAVARATEDTLPLVRELAPDVLVSDILTLAPALAAELAGVRWATLIPHVFPYGEPHFPVYSLGAKLARTAFGRALWRSAQRPVQRGLELGRVELNRVRTQLGLDALAHFHGGISRQLALIATFPQLEYPRPWPHWAHVVPSTAQDPEQRMLAAALRGLDGADVRVLATYNRRLPPRPLHVGPRQRVVDWVSYSRAMARCDLVLCHAGHGTLVRALASGCPVVACPAVGDMNENAARLDWAGAGVRVPRRFLSPRVLRLAVERALSDPRMRSRAREFASWAATHDAGASSAQLIERLATRSPPGGA
jgi:UDP:flavonoid glycosyltransferase YjiC (YdhE family)